MLHATLNRLAVLKGERGRAGRHMARVATIYRDIHKQTALVGASARHTHDAVVWGCTSQIRGRRAPNIPQLAPRNPSGTLKMSCNMHVLCLGNKGGANSLLGGQRDCKWEQAFTK